MLRIKNITILTALFLLANVMFVSGSLWGQSVNQTPVLQTVPGQYLLEGEVINLKVKASDSDGDDVSISMVSRPVGAILVDNGDGTADFSWSADFTGPNSSDGSPFEITFLASDGKSTASKSSEIVVINSNRTPYIVSPDTVTVQSGSGMNFQMFGYDPDFDATSWKLLSQPGELHLSGENPATANWSTSYADSGFHTTLIELSDNFGASDTAEVVMEVLQTTVYDLTIDTISAYPGEMVEVGINLMNLESISDINLVVNYDASVLTFVDVTTEGTRLEDWEQISYTLNNRGISGDIKIVGSADIDNEMVTENLVPGDGTIIRFTFSTSFDLSYAGFSIPISFVYRDLLEGYDNTMTSALGEWITQDMITYANGGVKILNASQESLGDINQNGVPYEIGDVITFTNHFIYPGLYSFTPLQILLSDVNQDGYGATIADLVYMIHHMLNFSFQSSKLNPDFEKIDIITETQNDRTKLYYNSDYGLGGIIVNIELDNSELSKTENLSKMEDLGLTVKSSIDGNQLRMLIFSEEGFEMPSGTHEFLNINANTNITINEIQVSSTDGYLVESVLKNESNGIIPGSFILHQNCPNPFNPSTEIRFDLPVSANLRLTVYNILGQEVVDLVDGFMTAGSHSVTWNGTNRNGATVASGVYFYRLNSDEFSDKKKMILLK